MREIDVRLPDPALEAMGLGDAIDAIREAGLRAVADISCEGPGGVGAFAVEEPVDDALEDLDAVAWWERLADDGTTVTYLCKLVAPGIPEDTPAHHELGIDQQGVTVDEHGVAFTLVGSQDALGRNLEQLEAADVPVLLGRLGDYAGPGDALDALTDRQREVLETARDLGYFEVPRAATAADVAADLDLDPSTVTEHLQRAERNLVSAVLPG